MYRPAVAPPRIMETFYGPKPKERAVNLLEDMVSVEVEELFPRCERANIQRRR